MSSEEADSCERFLGKTKRGEHVEQRMQGESSSSSSDGSNELQQNQLKTKRILTQSITPILQRPSTMGVQLNHGTALPSTMGVQLNHGTALPVNNPAQTMGNSTGGFINNYHLPTSNLPPEFRLDFSSGFQNAMPLGSGNGGSPFVNAQWANWQPQNQNTMHEQQSAPLGTREFQFQGLLNQPAGISTCLYPNGGPPSHQIQFPNIPIQQQGIRQGSMQIATNQYEVGESSASRSKVRMIWQDGIGPTMGNSQRVFSQGQGNQGKNHSLHNNSNSRFIRNSMYDPMYESLGLPVDPHLRMFLARQERGN